MAWIACLAILFHAFVPILSSARAAVPAAMQAEICTALGMATMSVPLASGPSDPSDPSAGTAPHKGMAHCGDCVAQAGQPGLPAAPPGIAAAAAARRVHGTPCRAAGRSLLSPWPAGQPRAPPVPSP